MSVIPSTIACAKVLEGYGIHFGNIGFLQTALTHSTYSKEQGNKDNYERMEFLGDSVLGLSIVDYLYHRYPDKPEGYLTGIKTAVVSEEFLAKAARSFHLYDFIIVGKAAEKVGDRYRDSMQADVIEAIIAAIYLDQGFEKAKSFIFALLQAPIDQLMVKGIKNYKTLLQEYLQKDFKKSVSYKVLEELGEPHNRIFKIGVYWEENLIAIGMGKSKQEAEKQGARLALDYFTQES